MIKLFIIPAMIMLGCGPVKSNQSSANTDSVVVNSKTGRTETDSMKKELLKGSLPNGEFIPTCINNKLDSFARKQIYERPQKMVEYVYKGKKVYYVVMPCCDFFNEVYDEQCNYMGAPDGGFTGQGDGKLPGFFTEAKNEKLIWQAGK